MRTARFEDLAETGGGMFEVLDQLMVPKLTKTLPRNLRVKVEKKEMETNKEGTTLSGRQLVWLMYDYF